jgi:NAD(P)-dependent dehydrogenase (short-subunit alcohol dehydrogenase family)
VNAITRSLAQELGPRKIRVNAVSPGVIETEGLHARGLYVHQMIGILPDKARQVFRIPDGVQALTGLAIGYVADPSTLPENLKGRDLAPRTRKKLAEFVFGGRWGTSSTIVE